MNKTLLLLTTVSPLSLMAQDETRPTDNKPRAEMSLLNLCRGATEEDQRSTDKVVKNRNIMLNELCVSQPRQIPMVCESG